MVNKKGLLLTLMAVAFAGLYATGYALAPVVTDPGDIVIGDLESGAANNVFAFPDAFSLDSIVSDDTTPDASILWSYSGLGDDRIRINNVLELAVGLEDPNAPGAKEIRSSVGDSIGHPKTGGGVQDAVGETVTFRNQFLSDIGIGGGFGPYTDPPSTGVLASETRAITLYASDTNTYTAQTIVVYTANNSSDSISGSPLTNIFDNDYTNPALRTGWLSNITGGASAGTTGNGTGFCMWVPLLNTNTASVNWLSPNNSSTPNGPGYITLVDNACYRMRVTMYCDQTAGGAIPFWTFGYNNFFYAPGPSSNIYGGDFFQVDNAGGSSGIGRTQGRIHYDFWFMPNAALTQQWRGTLPPPASNAQCVVGNPLYETRNDINVSVRILDSANNVGIHNEQDTGTVCLKELRADRIDYYALTSTLVFGPPISSSNYAVFPDREGAAGGGTGTIVGTVANFTLAGDYATDTNGGRKLFTHYDPAGADVFLRERPLANNWHTDELLLLKSSIRSDVGGAAGTVEGTDPVNLIFMDWDTRTNEVGGFNFTQKGAAGNMKFAAAPRLLATTGGVAQEYVSLFFTQNKTRAVAIAQPDRIRGYLDFINNATLDGNGTNGRNPFSVTKMELWTVDTSTFGVIPH